MPEKFTSAVGGHHGQQIEGRCCATAGVLMVSPPAEFLDPLFVSEGHACEPGSQASQTGRPALYPRGLTRWPRGCALLVQLDSLVQAAVSKKASLEYSHHDEPVFVDGDENQLLQVIMNLITNAAEALGDDEGRIVLATEIAHCDAAALDRLDAQADLPSGEYVRLTVRDTGRGMDAETASKIFDPFFTTKLTGRGLGLSAVKGIVGKHRGVIHVDSTLGEGTTFTVLLPRVGEPEPVESTPVVDAPAVLRNKCVLVVDDDIILRTILAKRLQRSGFDVLAASDGQQAVSLFSERPDSIDCVLLDVSMPKLWRRRSPRGADRSSGRCPDRCDERLR